VSQPATKLGCDVDDLSREASCTRFVHSDGSGPRFCRSSAEVGQGSTEVCDASTQGRRNILRGVDLREIVDEGSREPGSNPIRVGRKCAHGSLELFECECNAHDNVLVRPTLSAFSCRRQTKRIEGECPGSSNGLLNEIAQAR
jgi:hypothetical protein